MYYNILRIEMSRGLSFNWIEIIGLKYIIKKKGVVYLW